MSDRINSTREKNVNHFSKGFFIKIEAACNVMPSKITKLLENMKNCAI